MLRLRRGPRVVLAGGMGSAWRRQGFGGATQVPAGPVAPGLPSGSGLGGPGTGLAGAGKRTSETLRVTAIDRKGEARQFVSSRVDMALQLGFPLRDLRALTRSFDISQILVRAEAVVLNLKYVRAVLTADAVMLVDGTRELEAEVKARIATPFPARLEPFEVLAMEGMLHYMHDRLQAELGVLEPAVYKLLESLEKGDPSETQLRALLSYSKKLGAFAYDIGELKGSLDQLLLSDEDMAACYLADTRDGVGGRLQNHQEIEILLENYTRRLDELRNAVAELQGYIGATEAFLKIRYDGQRNKIMRQTLLLSMATFSMGSGTIVSSIFGMNLLSGLEHHPMAFWLVSGGVGLSSLSVFGVLLASYRRNSQFRSK